LTGRTWGRKSHNDLVRWKGRLFAPARGKKKGKHALAYARERRERGRLLVLHPTSLEGEGGR